MADLKVIRRDKGFFLYFTVNDAAGDPFNLTDYTITFKMWRDDKPMSLLIDGACTPVVAGSGTCKYSVATDDFNQPANDYMAKLELTKTGVIESTLLFTIEIVDSG